MWTRAELKTRAKAVLKTNYLIAFLMSLVLSLSGYGGSSGTGGAGSSNNGSIRNNINIDYNNFNNDYFDWNFLYNIFDRSEVFIIMFAITIITIAYRILIGFQFEVGSRKFFVQSADFKDNTGCIRYAFDGQNYKGIMSTMLLKGIYNFLWFLLLIIPGIIKFYAYRMVPYILADNPNIGASRAIELSKEMMDGNKFSLFVLDISFIGWYFLGALLFGIGVLFVNPYVNATEAELYLVLRRKIFDNNLLNYSEINTNFYK
jgi:uncharacterized membrane protein